MTLICNSIYFAILRNFMSTSENLMNVFSTSSLLTKMLNTILSCYQSIIPYYITGSWVKVTKIYFQLLFIAKWIHKILKTKSTILNSVLNIVQNLSQTSLLVKQKQFLNITCIFYFYLHWGYHLLFPKFHSSKSYTKTKIKL